MEVVQKRIPAGDRTLSDERGSIGPVCAPLKDAVPVLKRECEYNYDDNVDLSETSYNTGGLRHSVVCQLVNDIDLEMIPLLNRTLINVP